MTVIKEFDPFNERDRFGDIKPKQQEFNGLFSPLGEAKIKLALHEIFNTQTTNFKLHKDLVKDLSLMASRKGVGLQPFITAILTEYVNEHFVSVCGLGD